MALGRRGHRRCVVHRRLCRREVERYLQDLDADTRRQIRQARARPVADAFHAWMAAHRLKVPDGSAIAKALDYSLTRWAALTRYLDDGTLPPDNNHVENQIRESARSSCSHA